jgi:hypothetical protein
MTTGCRPSGGRRRFSGCADGVGLLEVADHHDVLVVQGGRGFGVVEAAHDQQPVVDDHQLMVDP